MKIERITTARALDEMKAGRRVYMLVPADLGISLEEYLQADFVLEELEDKELSFANMLGEPDDPEEKDGAQPIHTEPSPKKKRLDWGKIQALHNAGWSHA